MSTQFLKHGQRKMSCVKHDILAAFRVTPLAAWGCQKGRDGVFLMFRTHKVIYRRYAGLFFSMCVDITDNELAYLECIHLFVEILDHFFSNVCELDLVFNFHKVYLILDEFILAGELQETSKKAIIERMGELEKLE
ncbi:AP-2 complex subunit sigma-like isoform X2 [Phragmites australis]|uniref:AP-2 complex subunit sigma-like isoform X2 n=1 Tax=Phragmites australis TaxID=29695 RepID=UPI002D79A3F7|nr:AP-2 complex subunit sigma-like isoform X2 [Phragmites australis]XP_062202781.1 AP-2 complex subunit sigma-like isoform X2 [Phragmites australis]